MNRNGMLGIIVFFCAISAEMYGSSGSLMVDPLLDADLNGAQGLVVNSLNDFVSYMNDRSSSSLSNPNNIKSLNNGKKCYSDAGDKAVVFRNNVDALFKVMRNKFLPIQNADGVTFSSRVAWKQLSSLSSFSITVFTDSELQDKQNVIRETFIKLVNFINTTGASLTLNDDLGDNKVSLFIDAVDNFERAWRKFASAVFAKHRAVIDARLAELLNNAMGQQVSADKDLTIKISSKDNQNVLGNNNAISSDNLRFTDNSGQKQNSDNVNERTVVTDNSGQSQNSNNTRIVDKSVNTKVESSEAKSTAMNSVFGNVSIDNTTMVGK